MTDTVDKLIIQSETRGVQQTTNEVQGLSKAMDGVSVASEKVERSTGSMDGKFAALERRLGTTAAQARQLEKDQKTINDAVAQNPALAARAAEAQSALASRYAGATKASAEFAASTGLARHELINLSRQAQDVVVSLQGGQGIGTVFLQQGSQILDVLGTSQGGIRGSLGALGTSLRSVLTVGRVAFAGIAAAAGTAAFATADYLSQQKNVERSLIGAGRRSASPADISRIADERSSPTGFSVSEAREAAVEFAKTGQIHSRVIGEMIETTKNFALVTGQSSKEAAAALSGAFTNIQGIDNLNKQFNFLDANTRRTVENLLLAGRTTEAAALANDRLKLSLKDVEATQGGLEKGWNAIANAISNASTRVGEFIAKQSGLQRSSPSDAIREKESEIGRLQSLPTSNIFGDTSGAERVQQQIERLRGQVILLKEDLAKVARQDAFNALSNSAARAVAATDPLRASLDAVVGKMTMLRDAQAQGINIPGLQMALTYYEQIAQQLQNQMQAQDALAAKYPGMTAEFAKQVNALEDQNRLLKARQSGTEATVSAAIAYENAIEQGANSTEAAAIKSLTLKNNLLQAASAAGNISIQLDNMDWSEFDAYVARGGHSPGSGGFLGDAPGTMAGYSGSFRRDMDYQTGQVIPFLTETYAALRGDYSARDQRRAAANQRQTNFDNAQSQFLSGGSTQDRIAGMEMQIDTLSRTIGENPENYWQIMGLRRSIEELRNSVDENTDAINKVTLNPLYTEGRSALRVGYMHAAKGLDFIAQGPTTGDQVPVHIKVNGGERVRVETKEQQAASNDNTRAITSVTNNIVINGTQSTSRRSARQFAQKYGQMVAGLS